MRKTFIVLLVVGLLILGASQAVLAFGLGEGRGMKDGICGGNRWFDALTPEDQERIAEIKEAYRAKLTVLKEKIRSLREAKDLEGLTEARAELAQLKQETREQIQSLLPEEYRDLCGDIGPGKKSGVRNRMMGCFGPQF